MTDAPAPTAAKPAATFSRGKPTALLVLADGTVFEGQGFEVLK